MDGRTYLSPGRCIYCGATEGLTDEHIMPLSMNGNRVIEDASCEPCRVITCKVENAVTHVMWGSWRAQRNMRSRRRRSRASLRVRVEIERAGAQSEALLPPREAPAILAMLNLPSPGILCGRSPRSDGLLPADVWAFSNVQAWAERNGAERATLKAAVNVPMFYRMLAKIAHGMTVSIVGLDTFEPFLIPLILGELTGGFDYWIGGTGTKFRRDRSKGPFDVALGYLQHAGRTLIIVSVHLFPDMGAPDYRVVVGAMKGSNPKVPGSQNFFVTRPLRTRGKTGDGSHLARPNCSPP